MEADDETLAKKAIEKGDRQALRTLLERLYPQVYGFCYKLCGNPTDAEDIAQETIMEVARGLPRFTFRSRLRTWVFAIARNKVMDHFRQYQRETEKLGHFARDPSFSPPTEDSPEVVVLRKTSLAVFMQLPVEIRETLLLLVDHGLTHKETATMLGVAESTISWRVMKAKQLLAEGENAYAG